MSDKNRSTLKCGPDGPGLMLKQARKRAGLSVDAVAEKLHLLRSVINSIEEDSYERIRGETFVRGYMRNYARLVKVPPEQVLKCYETQQKSGAAPRITSSNVKQITSEPQSGRATSVRQSGLGLASLARRIGR